MKILLRKLVFVVTKYLCRLVELKRETKEKKSNAEYKYAIRNYAQK